MTWGAGFDQKRAGLEGGGEGGQLVHVSYNPFKGINLTVLASVYYYTRVYRKILESKCRSRSGLIIMIIFFYY